VAVCGSMIVSFCFARCPFAITQKLDFAGLVTEGGHNKPQIWNPQLQFAYSLYNFYRATMTIEGTLLLNNSAVKHLVEKAFSPKNKPSPILAKISTVFAII